MESKKAEEIKKKAEADASRMLKEAEQKGRLIIEEAKKKADAVAGKTLKEVEQKGRLIIEEAKKKADAEASKILKEVEQKGRHYKEAERRPDKEQKEPNLKLKQASQPRTPTRRPVRFLKRPG